MLDSRPVPSLLTTKFGATRSPAFCCRIRIRLRESCKRDLPAGPSRPHSSPVRRCWPNPPLLLSCRAGSLRCRHHSTRSSMQAMVLVGETCPLKPCWHSPIPARASGRMARPALGRLRRSATLCPPDRSAAPRRQWDRPCHRHRANSYAPARRPRPIAATRQARPEPAERVAVRAYRCQHLRRPSTTHPAS